MMSKKSPQLRFEGFTDDWEERKLGDLSQDTIGGGTPKTSVTEFWNGEIPWIQSSDLANDKLYGVLPKKFITEDAVKNSATKLIPANSIAIVTRVGVGKLAFMPYEFASSQDFLSLSNLQVDCNFGMYSIYKMLQRELNNIQGTSIKGITKADLLDKETFVPIKVKEQQKIGSFFKQLDDTIALHQRKLDLLKEQKKGYLQKMFPKNGAKVPELRFAGFADDWEERKLSNYITITGGNAWKSSDYSIGGDYLVVTIANVQGQRNINDKIGNKISVADPGKYLLKREDILVSLTGNVGRVSRMTDIPAVLNQRVGLVKPKTKKIDDEFLFQVLSNRRFESSMVASGQGAAQANISNNDVLSYELLVPQDVREQSIIAHFFRNFDNAIALHQHKLELLKEKKKGFLQKMFV